MNPRSKRMLLHRPLISPRASSTTREWCAAMPIALMRDCGMAPAFGTKLATVLDTVRKASRPIRDSEISTTSGINHLAYYLVNLEKRGFIKKTTYYPRRWLAIK